MQWLTGVILDAHWAGATAAGTRVYAAEAYRAAFGLCLAVSTGAFVAACFVKETHCQNIWRTS